MDKGYYCVRFYNHRGQYIMYFNGERFESFPSERMPHDEIDLDSVEHIEVER